MSARQDRQDAIGPRDAPDGGPASSVEPCPPSVRQVVVCFWCRRKAWMQEKKLPFGWEEGPMCRECFVLLGALR